MLQNVLDEIRGAASACARDPESVHLVAVTKGKSVEAIQELYDQGIRVFGESRVQEALEKQKKLPQDIAWHLIGTLQTKKVPKAIGHFALIHSVDSLELATKLSFVSQERGLVTNILLQVNTSGEQTKHGFRDLEDTFAALLALPALKICGLMTMAPNTDDVAAIRDCFMKAARLQKSLQERYSLPYFTELSMGMSNDFPIAIEAGATLVRIGSRLF